MTHFKTLTQMDALIAQIRSLTEEEIAEAGKLIQPIKEGTPLETRLSDDGIRTYALLVIKWEYLEDVGRDLQRMYDTPHSGGNVIEETEALLYELSAETSVLWEYIEYECLRRFPTHEGRHQRYDIGPNYQVSLLFGDQEEEEAEFADVDESAEDYFLTIHQVPGPSGRLN